MWIEILIIILIIRFIFTYTQRCQNYLCLTGKTIIITGGSKGLGFELASALAARNCKVIIGCRSDQEAVRKKLIERTKNNNVIVRYLDTASLESVRKFSKEIHEKEKKIDVLINNAGIAYSELKKTADGLDALMQTNYFGHFLLTHLLIDLLKQGELKRLVFVGSCVSVFNNLTLDNINNPKIPLWNPFQPYHNSKYCMLIASNIFAKKLAKYDIVSNCVHPGIILTNIMDTFDHVKEGSLRNVIRIVMTDFTKLFMIFLSKNVEQGIAPILHAAICKNTRKHYVGTGRFLWDFGTHPSRGTNDPHFCEKIWEISEELVKLKNHEKSF